MCKVKSGISIKLANGELINNKFNDILVVGNGFDLFLGKKTKYSDFFYFIILYRILFVVKQSHLFPIDSFSSLLPSEYRTQNYKLYGLIDIVDSFLEIYKNEADIRFNEQKNSINSIFFKGVLILIFGKNYLKLFKEPDKFINSYINTPAASNSDFNTFKTNLFNHIIELKNLIEPALKVPEKTCNSWTDVEQFIEYVVLGSHDLQCKFDSIKGLFDDFQFLKDVPNKSSDIYKSLQSFCNEFSLYLNAAQKTNDIPKNSIGYQLLYFRKVLEKMNIAYSDSLKVRSKNIIDNISFLNLKCIIDFNYTKTTDIFIKLCKEQFKSNNDYQPPCVCHINGEIDSNNLIFGYSRDKDISVSKDCFSFEKFTQRIIKNTQFVDFKNLLAEKFNVLVFGHSCSLADRDVIKKLLSSDNLGLAVIYCHDIPSLISISNNLQEILGPDRMETLLDYSEYTELVCRDPSYVFSLNDEDPLFDSNDPFGYILHKFHPVLFFCVESQNDDFLKIKYSNSISPINN